MSTHFSNFHLAFPPDEGHAPYDAARHDEYADKVPPELLNEWREFGFGSYGNGIIWTVSPDENFPDQDKWPELDGTGIVLLRSAFGDFCVWQGGAFLWVEVLKGRTVKSSADAEIIFNSLAGPDFRKQQLFEGFFTITRKRLGPLTKDECYGFSTLPALGGAVKEKHLIKEPMRPYLSKAASALVPVLANLSSHMQLLLKMRQR